MKRPVGCSVSGVLILDRPGRGPEDLAAIDRRLREVVRAATDRGRDSCGFYTIDRGGGFEAYKRPGLYDGSWPERLVGSETRIVVNNCRAEPTTEHVERKGFDDIQPFEFRGLVVSHNGVVANDRALEEKYGIQRRSRVDSSILPAFLDAAWLDRTTRGLADALREVVGSYALAVADASRPDAVFLAVNYKPLFIQFDHRLGAVFFSSLEEYLGDCGLEALARPWLKTRQVPPYSVLKVDSRGGMEAHSLWERGGKRRRALCVCSAGLDSTVAAAYAQRVWGMDITLCHFLYGCRAENRERERIPLIAEALGCDYVFIPLEMFPSAIKGSRLTDRSQRVVKDRDGEAGAEFAHEWVPARNLIMLSVAVGYAEAHGYDAIVLGVNLEEAGAFPDNEMMFVRKLNEVLPYAVNVNRRVEILMPVGNLMKHEIVKLGVDIGAPIERTWSCYEGEKLHCGACGPCYMRRNAFRINGLPDPTVYSV